jgi:hypothetical protein
VDAESRSKNEVKKTGAKKTKQHYQLNVELKRIDTIEIISGISLISIYLTPARISVII